MRAFLNYFIAAANLGFTLPLALGLLARLFLRTTRRKRDRAAGRREPGYTQHRKKGSAAEKALQTLSGGGGVLPMVLTWGLTGLMMNALLNVETHSARVGVAYGVALLCSVFGTRVFLSVYATLFRSRKKAISNAELIGLSGRVISGQITPTFGTVRVQVPQGPELTVSCRAAPAETPPVKGDTVVLVNYDSAKQIFDVQRSETAAR